MAYPNNLHIQDVYKYPETVKEILKAVLIRCSIYPRMMVASIETGSSFSWVVVGHISHYSYQQIFLSKRDRESV